MKVLTIDGDSVKWKPVGTSSKDNRKKSNLHQCARLLLKEKYVTYHILEEVSIPVTKKRTAYLDFYIPLIKRAFEIQGQQHFKFIPHFHLNILGFAKQKNRDIDKTQWCELNDVEIIYLRYDNQDKWKELI